MYTKPGIKKDIMRDFWSGVGQSLKPGSYLSGDEGNLPKGYQLIKYFKELSKKSYIRDNDGNIVKSGRTNWEDIRNWLLRKEPWRSHSSGLSTDSYLALLKQANRENSPYYLRYSPDGFTEFNSQSIDNKFISDLLEKTKTGEATQQEFLEAFHNWVSPYGGMDAKIVNGKIIIPHPFLYKKKQGGKMNILQFLKNGSGIHIKKENRGKFTDYCGGKVTSECIAKGKRSSNPAIRKRATFAANARKWKHEDGGKVKKHQAFVNGVSILDSNPDAYKYVKKKIKKAADGDNSKNWFSGVGNWLNKNQGTISTIGSTITNGIGLIKQNSELSAAKAAKKKELDAKYNPNNLVNDSEVWNKVNNQISQLEQQNPDVHYGEIDKLNLYNKIRSQYLSQAKQYTQFAKAQEQQQYDQYISDAQAGNTSSLMNLIGNGISTGIGMLSNKKTTESTPKVSTPTYQPSYKYDMMAPYKKNFTA